MEKQHIRRLIIFSCLLLSAADDDFCRPASCSHSEPLIRFPFRLAGRQPPGCGYPGFHLSCDKQNKTIIRLPSSGSYIVNSIDYLSQVIYIDPDFCRRNQIDTLNLNGTPFDFPHLQGYTFYNCSVQKSNFTYPVVRFPCFNSTNHSVVAVRPEVISPRSMPSGCKVMKTIWVPVSVDGDIRSEMELVWFGPSCGYSCQNEGRTRDCGPQDRQSGCFGSSGGIPSSARYGLSLGIGVPASICIIGLICYAASRARDYSETHHQSINLSSITIIPQPLSRLGLDGPTIESYPITTLGESCRLPNDDSTCAICLSTYKPKESLRTIPECNHYFHVGCIDEWLKLNATCPVCRNMPESSSMVTPCSLTSVTSVVS